MIAMMTIIRPDLALLATGAAPLPLLMAMTLSYVLCFAGMIFAWISYRRRKRDGGGGPGEGEK